MNYGKTKRAQLRLGSFLTLKELANQNTLRGLLRVRAGRGLVLLGNLGDKDGDIDIDHAEKSLDIFERAYLKKTDIERYRTLIAKLGLRK